MVLPSIIKCGVKRKAKIVRFFGASVYTIYCLNLDPENSMHKSGSINFYFVDLLFLIFNHSYLIWVLKKEDI